MEIQKLCLIAFFMAITISILKEMKSSFGIWIQLGCSLLLIFAMLDRGKIIYSFWMDKVEDFGIDIVLLRPLIKGFMTAYLCEFAAEFCKESGCNMISKQIETAGKVFILCFSIPILTSLIETMAGIRL